MKTIIDIVRDNLKNKVAVVEVEWTEYERGFGQRPDGFSYHSTLEKAKQFVDEQNELQSGRFPKGQVPDVYVQASKPKLVLVDPVFKLLVDGNGLVWTQKQAD